MSNEKRDCVENSTVMIIYADAIYCKYDLIASLVAQMEYIQLRLYMCDMFVPPEKDTGIHICHISKSWYLINIVRVRVLIRLTFRKMENKYKLKI